VSSLSNPANAAKIVIRVYDDASNVIETNQHKGDFRAINSILEVAFPVQRKTTQQCIASGTEDKCLDLIFSFPFVRACGNPY